MNKWGYARDRNSAIEIMWLECSEQEKRVTKVEISQKGRHSSSLEMSPYKTFIVFVFLITRLWGSLLLIFRSLVPDTESGTK